jgi:hypothetical protein
MQNIFKDLFEISNLSNNETIEKIIILDLLDEHQNIPDFIELPDFID